MLRLHVRCPHCGIGFDDPAHPIDDQPSVLMQAEAGGQRGWIRLSTMYGSYALESEHELPAGEVVGLICRSCGKEMPTKRSCELCEAPMAKMTLASGGAIQVCLRMGCKKHVLEFEDVEGDLQPFVDVQLMD